LGNVVKEINPQGLTKEADISVEDLPEGAYMLITESKSKIHSKKIIIY